MSIKEKLKKNKVVDKIEQIERPKKEKSPVRKDTSKRTAFFYLVINFRNVIFSNHFVVIVFKHSLHFE